MGKYYIYNGVIYSEDELRHYGVVGMKWGKRKAQKRGETYTYTSWGTKRYKRMADRAAKRGDLARQKKYDNYYKKSVELDAKMQKNALANSGARAVAKALFLPIAGGRTYEAVKAATGGSKYASRGAATVAAALSGPFGASVARAAYVRGYKGDAMTKKIDKSIDRVKDMTVDSFKDFTADLKTDRMAKA